MNQGQTDLISVIIPVYKVEKYLDKCVQSVVNQTYRNLEIILVDDGSPDRCGEMCDAWAQKDSRIRVIHKTNGGLSDARNAGLDIATGAYIGFVDSDDYIHPEMYQRLEDSATKHDADMAICGFQYVDENGNLVRKTNGCDIEDGIIDKCRAMEELNRDWRMCVVWNKLYKRDLFSMIRFPCGKIHEDEFVAHEMLYKSTHITWVSQILYYYLQRQNGIKLSSSAIARLDGVEALYDRVLFYERTGNHILLDETAKTAFDLYLRLRKGIVKPTWQDKKRCREVKKMVRYCIKRHGSEISMREIISFEFPHLFRFLQHIRNRMLFRK